MCKLFTLLVLSILFVSCENVMQLSQDLYSNYQLGYSNVYYSNDFKGLDTPEKIDAYLDEHLVFDLLDSYPSGSAEEILNSGKANCRGYSKVFVNIMYVATGDKYGFAIVHTDNKRAVADGGPVCHCIVKNGSMLIEPQSGKEVFYSKIGYTYTFDDVFYDLQ